MSNHAIVESRRIQIALGAVCLIVVIVLGGAIVVGMDMANYFESTRLVTTDPIEGGTNPFRAQDASATTVAPAATGNAAPAVGAHDAVQTASQKVATAQ